MSSFNWFQMAIMQMDIFCQFDFCHNRRNGFSLKVQWNWQKSFYRINHHSMIDPRFYVDGKRLFVRNVPPLKVRGKRAPWLRLFVRKCRWWTISEECFSTPSLFPRQKEWKEKKNLVFFMINWPRKKGQGLGKSAF